MIYFSARLRRERNFSRFVWRFRLNLTEFNASAEGASVIFGVFSTGIAHDVIIFKFQEGATAPGCPLRAPMYTCKYMHNKLAPTTCAPVELNSNTVCSQSGDQNQKYYFVYVLARTATSLTWVDQLTTHICQTSLSLHGSAAP